MDDEEEILYNNACMEWNLNDKEQNKFSSYDSHIPFTDHVCYSEQQWETFLFDSKYINLHFEFYSSSDSVNYFIAPLNNQGEELLIC